MTPLPTIGEDDLLEIDFVMEERLLVKRVKARVLLCFDLDDEEDDEEDEADDGDVDADARDDHESAGVAVDSVSGLARLSVPRPTSSKFPPLNVHALSKITMSTPLPVIGEDDLLEIDFAMEDHLLVTRAKELAHLCFVHFDLDDEDEDEEEEEEEEEDEEGEGGAGDNDHALSSVVKDAVSGLTPLEVSTATSLPLPPLHAHTDSPRSAQSKPPSPKRSITRAIVARSYYVGTTNEGVGVLTRRRERLVGKCRAYRPP